MTIWLLIILFYEEIIKLLENMDRILRKYNFENKINLNL